MIEAKRIAITAIKTTEKAMGDSIIQKQDGLMKKNLEQLSEKGASSWLSAAPLEEHGFNLNKSEFQDALNIRYDKPLKNLPSKCACDSAFSLTHAMNCDRGDRGDRGGFIIARHNNVRNFEANLLKQVCNDVQLEPPLQSIAGYTFHRSANTREDARPDVRAKGFWRQGQNAYFDVRIINADNNSQRSQQCYP